MNRARVLLADDHRMVAEGLKRLLTPEFELLGVVEDGFALVEAAKKLRPDVIVADISMPLLNGLEATRQICKASPTVRVLILSAHSDDAYVDQAIELGAAGFLIKQTSSHVLATAIREVQNGKLFFSPSIASRFQRRERTSLDREGNPRKRGARLSSREMEVLQLIAEGMPNKEVAAELGVSFKTVDKHRQHLMGKLDIHDVAGLTRYAIAEGIIESTVRVTIT